MFHSFPKYALGLVYRQGLFNMTGVAPEHSRGIVRTSSLYAAIFPAPAATHPLSRGWHQRIPSPNILSGKGHATRRGGHLRPDNNESKHVTGSNRNPTSDSN